MEENHYQTQTEQGIGFQNQNQTQTLPYAVVSMVLGITSLVLDFAPIAGLIIAIIGKSKADKAYAYYNAYPGHYTGIEMAETGKITSTIGIVLGVLSIFFWIAYFAILFSIFIE